MKKYIADLGDKKFKSILYRGSYITIKDGEIFNEDAPVVMIFKDLFKEYTPTVNQVIEKTVENIVEHALEIENIETVAETKEISSEELEFDDFFETINTNEKDVIIETE